MAETKAGVLKTAASIKENRPLEKLKLLPLGSPTTRCTSHSKTRQPLTPIQKTGPSLDNEMVKAKKTADADKKSQSTSKPALTQIQKGKLKHRVDGKAKPKSQNGEKVTKQVAQAKEKVFKDQVTQTENPDVDLVTGDVPPPQYYEQLAEARGAALEETLTENKELWERVEKLEQENAVLIQLVGAEKVEELYKTVNHLDETAAFSSDTSEDVISDK